MKMIYIGMVSATILFTTACSSKPAETEASTAPATEMTVTLTEAQVQNAGITTANASQKVLSVPVYCTGVVDVPPDHRISIFPPMAGFIKRLLVLPGQKVKKGEILVTLTHPDYIELQKNYADAYFKQQFLEKDFERQKQLAAENATAAKSFEKSASEYQSGKALLSALAAQLQLLHLNPLEVAAGNIAKEIALTAPIDGYISMFTTNEGKFAPMETELFSIISKAHMHVELSVFEKDILSVREGQNIHFEVNGNSTPFEAYVKLIGQDVNTTSRTINVHGHIENEYPQLMTGMFVNAKIETGADTLWAVPVEAIGGKGDEHFIFVQTSPLHYTKVPVKLGGTHDGWQGIVDFPAAYIQKPIVQKGVFFLASVFAGGSGDSH